MDHDPLGGPDAATLAGLLADPDRRRVFAALVLDATTLDDIASASGLTIEQAGSALARLTSAGLVERIDGEPHLLAEAFARAARRAHEGRPTKRSDDAPAGSSREAAKVFAAFVREGRITQIPAAQAKRMVLLDWLAQDFEIGKRYSESMVNLILGKRHPDTAAWRRYLVDADLLSRADGVYWRSGGSVSVVADPQDG